MAIHGGWITFVIPVLELTTGTSAMAVYLTKAYLLQRKQWLQAQRERIRGAMAKADTYAEWDDQLQLIEFALCLNDESWSVCSSRL